MAGGNQNPIQDDASDDSIADVEFNPVEDLPLDGVLLEDLIVDGDLPPVEDIIIVDLSLGGLITPEQNGFLNENPANVLDTTINHLSFPSVQPIELPPIEHQNIDSSFFDEKITSSAVDVTPALQPKIIAGHQNSSTSANVLDLKSLLFNYNDWKWKVPNILNEKDLPHTHINLVTEQTNIASIIEILATIVNDDKWFELFDLALKSLQRIKDHDIKLNGKLVNIPVEAQNLATVLSTRLSLSAEHAALIKADLEKPLVDSIDFLFNVGQMTAASSFKYHM